MPTKLKETNRSKEFKGYRSAISAAAVGTGFYYMSCAVAVRDGGANYRVQAEAIAVSGKDFSFRTKAPSEEYFAALAAQWKRETGHLSVIKKRFKHPAYKAILAIGKPAIPMILREMRLDPDRWFDALEYLTDENPAENSETFYEAVDDWIAWGISNEFIA